MFSRRAISLMLIQLRSPSGSSSATGVPSTKSLSMRSQSWILLPALLDRVLSEVMAGTGLVQTVEERLKQPLASEKCPEVSTTSTHSSPRIGRSWTFHGLCTFCGRACGEDTAIPAISADPVVGEHGFDLCTQGPIWGPICVRESPALVRALTHLRSLARSGQKAKVVQDYVEVSRARKLRNHRWVAWLITIGRCLGANVHGVCHFPVHFCWRAMDWCLPH